jgi:hypothetical protein
MLMAGDVCVGIGTRRSLGLLRVQLAECPGAIAEAVERRRIAPLQYHGRLLIPDWTHADPPIDDLGTQRTQRTRELSALQPGSTFRWPHADGLWLVVRQGESRATIELIRGECDLGTVVGEQITVVANTRVEVAP